MRLKELADKDEIENMTLKAIMESTELINHEKDKMVKSIKRNKEDLNNYLGIEVE
jgi:hypothetical protein